MLRLQAHADEAARELLESGDAGEESDGERRSYRTSVLQCAGENAVGEELEALGVADGFLAIVLDACEIVRGCSAGE